MQFITVLRGCTSKADKEFESISNLYNLSGETPAMAMYIYIYVYESYMYVSMYIYIYVYIYMACTTIYGYIVYGYIVYGYIWLCMESGLLSGYHSQG